MTSAASAIHLGTYSPFINAGSWVEPHSEERSPTTGDSMVWTLAKGVAKGIAGGVSAVLSTRTGLVSSGLATAASAAGWAIAGPLGAALTGFLGGATGALISLADPDRGPKSSVSSPQKDSLWDRYGVPISLAAGVGFIVGTMANPPVAIAAGLVSGAVWGLGYAQIAHANTKPAFA